MDEKIDPNPQPLTEGQKAIIDAIPMREPSALHMQFLGRATRPAQVTTLDHVVEEVRSVMRDCTPEQRRAVYEQCPPAVGYTVLHAFAEAHRVPYNDLCAAVRNAVGSRDAPPIDMVLHCPACGQQHIDGPDDPRNVQTEDGMEEVYDWTNPPHRSHLCAYCGHIWRPADVATNGVQEIKTKGTADSPEPNFDTANEAQGYAIEAIHQFCPELRIREDGQTLLTPAQVEVILRRMGWKPPGEWAGDPSVQDYASTVAAEQPVAKAWKDAHGEWGFRFLVAQPGPEVLLYAAPVPACEPLTPEFIDAHIGADEGDREAVVTLVREVERAHGIMPEPEWQNDVQAAFGGLVQTPQG